MAGFFGNLGFQMIKAAAKGMVKALGCEPRWIYEKIEIASLRKALKERCQTGLAAKLATIVPDRARQYSRTQEWSDFLEIEVRGMYAFQTRLMLKALRSPPPHEVTVVDIGDSAGTHMRHLKEVSQGHLRVDTISVSLDPRAVEKIKAQGLKAIPRRAEALDVPGVDIDLFTSCEMVKRLHNPPLLFYRLAIRSSCHEILITVPYLKTGRVELHFVRRSSRRLLLLRTSKALS